MTESKSGFSLLEVLVAIVLTSLFISIFGQVFAIARGSNQIPGELFAAVSRARMVLAQAERSDRGGAIVSTSHFREHVELSKPVIIENPGKIAPPIRSAVNSQQPAPALRPQLGTVNVVITTSSGRRTELDGVTSFALP